MLGEFLEIFPAEHNDKSQVEFVEELLKKLWIDFHETHRGIFNEISGNNRGWKGVGILVGCLGFSSKIFQIKSPH